MRGTKDKCFSLLEVLVTHWGREKVTKDQAGVHVSTRSATVDERSILFVSSDHTINDS
jgi:hypothetical protein